jgi:uncharacterized membrane protein
MTTLVIGLILFLGIHSVSIVNEPWRNRMADQLGELPWKGIYAIIAIVGVILIIHGYAAARYDPVVLYAPPAWLRHLAFLLLLPVFPLILATYLPGRIQSAVKHPMILAVKFWALAHLLANGMLADVLLFGGFLAWAVAERISFKRRTKRPIPSAPASKLNDIVAVVGGLVLYVVFAFSLHPLLIGVPVV